MDELPDSISSGTAVTLTLAVPCSQLPSAQGPDLLRDYLGCR